MRLAFLFVVAVVCACFFSPARADAALHICNQTPQKVFVAVAVVSMETTCDHAICTKVDGWFNIEAGQCTTAVGGDLDLYGKFYYYYADDGYGGHKWSGDRQYCVDAQNSFHYWNPDESTCPTKTGFREITIDDDEITAHDKTVYITL
jgi:uncharacterized membrane protein